MAPTSDGYIAIIDDDGMLNTFTGKCILPVSGGNWVVAGSNTLAASLSNSGGQPVFNSDFVNIRHGGAGIGSGTSRPIGLALANTDSGGYVAVLRKGLVVLPVNGVVTAGGAVAATSVAGGLSCVANTTDGAAIIGIAYTAAASGTNNFALVRLDL